MAHTSPRSVPSWLIFTPFYIMAAAIEQTSCRFSAVVCCYISCSPIGPKFPVCLLPVEVLHRAPLLKSSCQNMVWSFQLQPWIYEDSRKTDRFVSINISLAVFIVLSKTRLACQLRYKQHPQPNYPPIPSNPS